MIVILPFISFILSRSGAKYVVHNNLEGRLRFHNRVTNAEVYFPARTSACAIIPLLVVWKILYLCPLR